MDPELRKELHGFVWAYFDRHAEQRLKSFNFYLIICAAVSAGILAFARAPQSIVGAGPQFLLLSFFSFVFWRLDGRNRQLVEHSEEGLKLLEDELDLADEADGIPHRLKVFRREESDSSKRRGLSAFTYTVCFNCTFCLFGCLGLVMGALWLLQLIP